MSRWWVGILTLGAVLLVAVTAVCQPPEGKGRGLGKDDPPRGRRGGPPGPFEPGRVLPPFIQDELGLTAEQQKQVQELEKEVKARLLKILTTEQKKKLEELRTRRPPGPPDGPGRPPEREGRPERPGRPQPPPPDQPEAKEDTVRAGIQWFATWESAAGDGSEDRE